MGKTSGKVRLRGVKGKRWRKGQSSSSNPESRKHRLAAKGRFGDHLAQVNRVADGRPKVELTKDALASHNAYQGDDDIELASVALSDVAVEGEPVNEDDEEDTPSLTMTTTSSAYSLIESAHPVFGKVKKLWNSPMESHREICAVLAAISDVIKSSGGKDTVTEYFGALVTAMESADDEKSCTAISFLLNTAMSKTPMEVLQSRYASVCKIVADKLSAYEMSDSVALLKHLVQCLLLLLGAQPAVVWSEGYTQRVYQLLLNYTMHPKPKLRRAAQGGVVSMLREGSSSGDFHCAVKLTASHCLHVLEKGGTETSMLHLLGMLKDCLANMKPVHVKLLCEQILKLVSIGNSVVRTTAFKTLHGLFSSVAGPQGLTLQLNAKLITALYDYQPSHQDVQLLNAWLVVMESAHQHLLNMDFNLGVAHLPKLFSCAVDCFMTNASFVKETAASLLQKILKRLSSHLCSSGAGDQDEASPTLPEAFCISIPGHSDKNLFQLLGPHSKSFAVLLLGEEEGAARLEAIEKKLGEGKVEEEVCCALFQAWLGGEGRKPVSWETLADILKGMNQLSLAKVVKQKYAGKTKEEGRTPLVGSVEKMFRGVEGGLKYKFLSSWKYVLSVLDTFYTVAGKCVPCRHFMTKSLLTLSELRMSPNFPYCGELDAAFGSAVTAMGPRVVLSAVPLDLGTGSLSGDFPRSWILPVLKDHVQRTELAYFTESMLPLAAALRAKGLECLKGGQPMEAKLYGTLQFQVWSLLPSFCTDTVDISKSFRPLARILGTALKEKAELQPLICRGLQQLIAKSLQCDEDKAVLSGFSKNFLPILFNLYSTLPKDEECKESNNKGLLLECIKAYITITDQELVDTFFSRLMTKLKDDATSSSRPLLLDVASALTPRLSQLSLVSLFQYISPLLDSGESALQKKAYSCLETLLSGSSVEHQAFLSDNLEVLRKILVESLSTATIASKKPRLRCLLHIVENLAEGSEDFVTSILPEVILSTKEVNEKARMLAYKLVLNIGRGSQGCFGGTPEESMLKYFTLVFAGLAGSPRMVSCTLLSLSKLVYEFHDLLGPDLVHDIFSSTLQFLSSSHREVVRSALALIRVAVGILPVQELHTQAEILVKTILCWGENKRNHFRLKYRALLERLVRRLDYDVVASFVPKKHQKLMVHIRKTTSRQKRRKMERQQLAAKEEEEHNQTRTGRHKPSYDELLQSSDEEDEDDAWVSKKERGRMYWKNHRDKKQGNKDSKKEEGKAWIKEGPEDEPINFMDPVVAKKVVATDPAKMKPHKNKKKSTFDTDSKGKLIIQDEDLDTMSDNFNGQFGTSDGTGRKRKRGEDDKEEMSCSGGSFGHGIYRTDAKKDDFKSYGAEYKAKRAKGDVKKKGAPDPYAYIPLNRQKLNKRKKAKLSGQFKNMVGKAVKGFAIGTKKRRRK